MNLNKIIEPILDDIKNIDKVINHYLNSKISLINNVSNYIINSGGKRLRPLILLMIAKSLGYKGSLHYLLAAIIEFIHTATLLHDDVIDNSNMRRGKKSANIVFGNSCSVLVGDYLYSRAFEMMVDTKSSKIIKIISEATTTIAEGEILQLLSMNNAQLSENDYFKVIISKTAKLFEASAHIGAILSKTDSKNKKSAIDYGLNIGIAFQLIDDILDYTGDISVVGKNLGNDLKEGKTTLPLIHAIQMSNHTNQNIIKEAITNGTTSDFNNIINIIHETDSLNYALLKAEKYASLARNAIEKFPESIYKDSLIKISHLAVKREF
ncbi:polyprenyl synthetase family protein [Candidatus Kinetoplastibacterium sorsogonicusi]|uniref:polyprenyl synthetase family protein n=1 Tax=Candidatus Kinetoplastidibacterium kentomonadis TaxID=1576550 RepID=UPI000D3EC4A5|nr:polyprenyl synthetase family protein [Candidatus Kinetoplastibacterium sorsogonicusi]